MTPHHRILSLIIITAVFHLFPMAWAATLCPHYQFTLQFSKDDDYLRYISVQSFKSSDWMNEENGEVRGGVEWTGLSEMTLICYNFHGNKQHYSAANRSKTRGKYLKYEWTSNSAFNIVKNLFPSLLVITSPRSPSVRHVSSLSKCGPGPKFPRHSNTVSSHYHHHLRGLGHVLPVPLSWRVCWSLHLNCGRPSSVFFSVWGGVSCSNILWNPPAYNSFACGFHNLDKNAQI